MPSFTNFVRGTLVTATFLNQLEKGLYWLQEDVLRLAMENALSGINPDYISLFYDLFTDTAEFDSGAVTPDMVIDTATKTLALPGGFSTGTDYYYQSVTHSIPATITKANLLLLKEDLASTSGFPSLSCVPSGAPNSFTEQTTPLSSRTTNATIDAWSESYSTTGNSDTTTTTATIDTANGRLVLPGAAGDAWETPTRVTTNAVADILHPTTYDAYETTRGVHTSANPVDGSVAIVYTSKEYNATYSNIRLRIVESDGSLRSFSGNTYVDVTTNTGGHMYTPMVFTSEDGSYVGVFYLAFTPQDLYYVTVNTTTGALGTPFAVNSNTLIYSAAKENDADFVYVYLKDYAGATTYLHRFALNAASAGAALYSGNPGVGSIGIACDVDQENDLHVLAYDGTNTLRFNYWDKSGGAWGYTWGSTDKTISRSHLYSSEGNFGLVADREQTASNKKTFVVYTKDNAGSEAAVYFRTITNGTVSGETTVKTDNDVDNLGVSIFRDWGNNVCYVQYYNAVDGLSSVSIDDSDTVGTPVVVDASATGGQSSTAVSAESTLATIAYRVGAAGNSGSELYFSTKPLGYTLVPKVWESVTYTTSKNVTRFLVSPSVNLPTGTTLTYAITANATSGSPTWETVTPGATGTFSVPGTQVRLRITLQTTDTSVTPAVYGVDWRAQLPLLEEEYEWTGLSGTEVVLKLRARTDGANNPTFHRWGIVVS